MTPLSVLRIWGLGIFSWLVLGVGIYLAVEAYQHFSHQRAGALIENRTVDLASDGSGTASDPLKDKSDQVVTDQGLAAEDSAAAAEVETRASAAQAAEDAAGKGRLADGEALPPVSELDEEVTVPRIAAASDDWTGWALVAGAVVCLGMTFLGYWPISLFLGDASRAAAHAVTPLEPTSSLVVGRRDGSQLHVNVYGNGDRPTLLLTHGWSLDASAWDYLKGSLGRHYRLVTWDLPGLGRSQGPNNADFSLEKMAHDLEAVARATANGAPLILVGHSIGGMIVQTFSRLYADQLGTSVHGLALVHTTYTNPLRTITASGLATALEKPLIVPLNYLTIALAPLAWLSNWQSYINGSLHVWTRLVSFAGHQSWRQIDHGARLAAVAWPATVARGNLAMFHFDEEQTLPQVQVPVLVVAGTHDRVTRPVASQHIERLLPNERPIAIDGGHLGYWEQSTQVCDALLEFAQHVVATSSTSATSGPKSDSLPAASKVSP